VQYAMRITYSGEFLHAAPWSVGSQGYANVSHGCVGMSTSNAQWLFDQVTIGDPVEVTGTSLPQNLGNGVTVWTTTWDEWLADSATGAIMTTAAVPSAEPTSPDATALPDGTDGTDSTDGTDGTPPVGPTPSQSAPPVNQASYGR
jgi:hypothetical protein